MKTQTLTVRIYVAWWLKPLLYACYPLIVVGAYYQPEQVTVALRRIIAKAVKVKPE